MKSVTVSYNAFKKLLSLTELQKDINVIEIREFKNTSEQSQWEISLLLSKLKLIQRVKDAKWFSILVDEVTDCATIEQLLIYLSYVDEEGKPHKDALETSDASDSTTII